MVDGYPVSPGVDPETAMMPAQTETIPPEQAEWLALAPDQPNLVEYFSEEQLGELARNIEEEHRIDRDSMAEWLDAMECGLKLAQGKRDEKTFPWKGASNVKYPLVTSAALQFNARAYPAIVASGDVVKAVIHGKDTGGEKAKRGNRVTSYMSMQLRREIVEWEADTDRLLMLLPIVGKMFRKMWYDPSKGRAVMRLCRPGKVVINNAAQSIQSAPRISEEMELYPHEVVERQRAGLFMGGDWPSEQEGAGDQDTQRPVEFIEQHRLFDFDGDGYPEPYVCVWHKASKKVVRIAANWMPDGVVIGQAGVMSIARSDYFEAYDFVPALDGGFWSVGLGLLLKDISTAIDDTINRICDGATLASLGGGFMGREARLAGGAVSFQPGEWKPVQSSGTDLRSSIVPLPVTPVSPVLPEMLGLLIEAAREVANVKDIAAEANRANQPATTTLALIEQGMAVFTAVYKRIYRALTGEFGRLAKINATTVDPQKYMAYHDEQADPAADFDLSDMDIEPTADPQAVTRPQRLAQAQLLREMAAEGQVDPAAATQRTLEAAGIEATEELMPKPDPMAQMAMEAQTRSLMLTNVKMGLEVAKLEAEIAKLHADATKAMADAEAADPMNPVNVALAQVEALKGLVDADRQRIEGLARASDNGGGAEGAGGNGGGAQDAGIGNLLAIGGSGPAPVGPGQGVY